MSVWTLRYAVRSDRGLVRSNNEDSVYAGPRLLAVADGMGGHAAGEVASKLVIAGLEKLDEDRNIPDLITTLRDAVTEANKSLARAVEQDLELEGMGTTLTAIRFSGSRIAVVHVGDSRAYLYRNGHLSQITHDDTYVQSLVDQGKLTSEEASHHPRKSVILRALNGSDVDPDISIREARLGDRYLICSDGLSDVVTGPTLLETLSSGTPQGCVDRLIELALRGGGPDNITCVVADVVSNTDEVDDVPLVGGAVIDSLTAQEVRPADSPAARAAMIVREEPKATPVPIVKAGRAGRRLVIAGVAAVAVAIAAIAGYSWTQGQYYVGRAGDVVAIYRGISGDYGPVRLDSVAERSQVRYEELNAAAKTAVSKGINARSRADASDIVTRLQEQLLPLCTPAVTTTPPSTPSATRSATPSTSASGTASRKPTVSPTRATTPAAAASASASASASAKPSSSPATTATPTPDATHAQVPYVDCRP